MKNELQKLKKASILSCVKYIILLIFFVYIFWNVQNSYETFLDNVFVAAFLRTVESAKEEMLLAQDKAKFFSLCLIGYSVFGIILNIIAYSSVKKTKNRFISFIFGLIKFCTLSCFSGLDYIFAKKLKDKDVVKTNKNNSYSNQTSNTSNKTYPKVKIKKRLGLRIFIAIIVFILICYLPLVNILIPYKIITGYKNKEWRFRKFKAMLKEGMCIDEVDSIMYEFSYQDGTNRHGEYVRIYKTIFEDENKKNKRDYEGVAIIFDSNDEIIEIKEGYRRTI